MTKNLVIVESPAKAKTIEKFLGKDFQVVSCFGHIRDLPKNKVSIDVENQFTPNYVIPSEKKKLVDDLKKLADKTDVVWLASDEDREGEAISWHLSQVLNLDEDKYRRIVFNEITKPAIVKAIEHPRKLDLHLVDAQQARRVLDRLVGYEISPVLWKKVKPQLSAGRVQSVAVRLIVEREEEIKNFKETFAYRVVAEMIAVKDETKLFEAELNHRFATKEEALQFLEACKTAQYKIIDTETKPSKRTPAPPFTTSTLQQEAGRKLGFSVAKTMMVAQQLYESGFITYMRSDSVHLSDLALGMTKEKIENLYGSKYVKTRQYATKSKGAQEAHEAIRPTYMDNQSLDSVDASQKRLYELIWKRTIASQMSDAEIDKTNINISISNRSECLNAKGEVLVFDGFLKVYFESQDDEDDNATKNALPLLKKGEELMAKSFSSRQAFTQKPPRYSEASLVKKMEELGIGRPSTYAPTISTIQKRSYVVKEDREGIERSYVHLEMKNNKITETLKKEKIGTEKAKLFPTDMGALVNNFLVSYFNSIVDYNFTAEVEKEFDEVAEGKQKWTKMMADFYKPFHKQVETSLEISEKVSGERLLGVDPKTGKNVYVKIGRFGPMAQIGESNAEEKPVFAGLKKNQSLDTITFEEVMDLFKLPRLVGTFEGEEMVASVGRFGPYIRHGKNFVSLPKTEDPLDVSEERAIEIILEKRQKDKEKVIKLFSEDESVQVLNGRFGPYVVVNKKNFKIPKSVDPASLTYQNCIDLSEGKSLGDDGKKTTKSKTTKKATAKKVATTKKK